jgi:hypothetical protein
MKELIDEITKLTEEWYNLIGPDHHKDRDCHWYIETKWSYGMSPIYCIHHYGYILDEITENWGSYELALGRLKEILTNEIKEYKNYIKQDDENEI